MAARLEPPEGDHEGPARLGLVGNDDYPLADWLTIEQVAHQLRVTERTIFTMIGDGRLAAIKHANQLLFEPTAAKDYFKRLRAEAEAERAEAERLRLSRGAQRPAGNGDSANPR